MERLATGNQSLSGGSNAIFRRRGRVVDAWRTNGQ